MAKEQLHGAQVLGPPINQRRLGSPHRVRPVLRWVKAKLLDPALKESGVLTRPQVRRVVDAAREQELVRSQPCELDPLLHGLTGSRCDFELHRPLGFVLHDDSP